MRAILTLAAVVLTSQAALAGDLSTVPQIQVKAYEAFAASHATMRPVLFESIGPIADGSTTFYGTLENSRTAKISNCGMTEKAKQTYSVVIDAKGVITDQRVGYFDIYDCD